MYVGPLLEPLKRSMLTTPTLFINHRILATLWDGFRSVCEILPVATFIFITSTPGQALAFADQLELAHQPLTFTRDPSLAGRAIIGIDAFGNSGTAGQLLSSPASQIPRRSTLQIEPGVAVRVMATGYSSTVDQTDGDPFTTASGTRVHPGTMAANFLPFGSRVRIGNTIYIVEDRLNSRYNGRYIVDLWFESRAEALTWGARVVEMEVVSVP